MGEVEFLERLHLKDTLEEAILTAPRFLNAELGEVASTHGPLAERVIEIPGQEHEFSCGGVEIDVKVLSHFEETVHRGEPDEHGQVARKLIEIEEVAQFR